MGKIETILTEAKRRANDADFPYAGSLTPKEASEILHSNPEARLLDVRTQAELDLVGKIPNAIHVEWATYPGMIANPDFATQLEAQLDKNSLLILMCRTGGRSHNAAVVATKLGFTQVYNMLEGFEGEANELKQRTLINGWKHAGLLWVN